MPIETLIPQESKSTAEQLDALFTLWNRTDTPGLTALDEAARSGDLTIRFGGHSAVYRKLSEERADVAAFVQAAIGQYYSEDGDCTATIARDGERLGADPVSWTP